MKLKKDITTEMAECETEGSDDNPVLLFIDFADAYGSVSLSRLL